MAKGTGTRKRNVEVLASRISGIDKRGDVVKVYVYRKGENIRLSGPHGSKFVHEANKDDIEGWKREVSLSWRLTDVIAHAPELHKGEQEKMELRELRDKGRQIKQNN